MNKQEMLAQLGVNIATIEWRLDKVDELQKDLRSKLKQTKQLVKALQLLDQD